MSFAGSLFLTGVGALVYKYDVDQVYEKHPFSQVSVKEYSQKVYKKEGELLSRRFSCVFGNFFTDFFDGSAFLFPFKGIGQFFKFKGDYALTALGLFALYSVMYTVVSMVYWATITPVYTALFAIFGPPGLFVAWIHSFLHTNMLTMMFMRLCHFNNNLVMITFKTNGLSKVFNKEPVKFYVPMTSIYFWSFHLPLKIFKYFMGTIMIVGLLVVSSFPIIGPFLFNYLISPFISKTYFSKSLRLKGYDNLARKDEFFEHFGQYTAFGISCGLLENIPILSGLALSTNSIGAALWAIENISQS